MTSLFLKNHRAFSTFEQTRTSYDSFAYISFGVLNVNLFNLSRIWSNFIIDNTFLI